jgi:Pyruvate/2-oxoglutarate dehydrogenase complex, dihydrolipoamide acyltransferase (E2) component, and related enzymes
LATPPVRKLARTLGVDLATVTGTGPGGRVSRADVETAARSGARAAQPPSAPTATGVRETRIPIRGVRRETARAMVTSAFTAPHVTEFVTVDVTESMRLLDRLRTRGEFARLRLSPLTLLARAMCVAAPRTPEINSHWDDAAQQIVLRHYVNLGIATSTERGLLVPNIRDADRLSFVELARAITGVVDTARRGRCTPEQVTGGTMSITNVGVFGIDSGTPILPPGQSAIVCLGVVAQRPWVVDGELSVRQVTTLGLSFDHRLVDGAQASRFLGDVAAMLTDPGLAVALS